MATKGLGRGLASLFSDTEEMYAKARKESEGQEIVNLPLAELFANPDQPRKQFDPTALNDLVSSIQEHGVIVPIIVCQAENGKYMIIAGERRFRAAKKAGFSVIPAIIKEYTPAQIEEIALIENLQREDLNPIEEATAMKRLMEEHHLTQEEMSVKIGKSRSAIANTLRLLSLPQEIVEYLQNGTLTAGHARAILTLEKEEQLSLARQIAEKGYSVRQTESAVKEKAEKSNKKPVKKDKEPSLELRNLIDRMRMAFKTKVALNGTEQKGKIVIDYYSSDDLERILELLDKIEK